MPIEWAAVSAVLLPHVTKYAREMGIKLASTYSDGVLSKLYRSIVPEEKLVQANQAFVLRFGKELDYAIDLPTISAEVYKTALAVFLRNDSVQDALQAPLDGQSDLDWQLLQ